MSITRRLFLKWSAAAVGSLCVPFSIKTYVPAVVSPELLKVAKPSMVLDKFGGRRGHVAWKNYYRFINLNDK